MTGDWFVCFRSVRTCLDQSADVIFCFWKHNNLIITLQLFDMSQYTEESLDKLLKRELIPIVLSFEEHNRTLQSRMSEVNNEVVEEILKFNENFSKLQSEFYN